MGKVRFPDLKKPADVPLFPEPIQFRNPPPRKGVTVKLEDGQVVTGTELRPDDESDEAFAARKERWKEVAAVRLKVRRLPDPDLNQLVKRARQLGQEERVRLRDLRKQFTREENPELFSDDFETDQGTDGLSKHIAAILSEMLVGIDGIEFGEGAELVDSSTLKDPQELISLLCSVKWHKIAAQRCMSAQTPDRQQFLR